MKSGSAVFLRLSIYLFSFFSSANLYGQIYSFRTYRMENNLPGNVVYTINQDNDGYLWVGTNNGIARFDGIDFFEAGYPDSTYVRYPTVSFKDKNGTLWFGCNDGSVFYSKGRNLSQVLLPGSSPTGISSILEGPDGRIYIIPQRQPAFSLKADDPSAVSVIGFREDPAIFSAAFTLKGDLILGTQENLMICSIEGDSLKLMNQIDGFDYARVMAVRGIGRNNDFLIGTDGNGLFRLTLNGYNGELERFSQKQETEFLSVRAIVGDKKGNLWISTSGQGVFKIITDPDSGLPVSVQPFTRNSGLPGENILTLYEDSEENMWMGLNGEGLSKLNNDSFQFFTPGTDSKTNNIIYEGKLSENYFLGTPTGFFLFDILKGKPISFTPVSSYTDRKEVGTYLVDNDDNVWIGTQGAGLYVMNRSKEIRRFYRSGDSGSDYITNLAIDKENIWLATINGVLILSRKNGSLKEIYNINNGLPPKGINQILLLDDGSAFIAAESDRLFRIVPGSGVIASEATMHGGVLNKVTGLARDNNGVIWAATFGNGLFEYHDDSVRLVSTANGLSSNYVYSVFADDRNNLWAGHERSFSMYSQEKDVVTVFSTDFAKSGQCNPNAFYQSSDGKLFIGTTEGLIVYDRTKDAAKKTAPVNNINSIVINNIEYPYQQSFTLPYKKRYSVRINYSGINLSKPEKVYYSTFLENLDEDWSQLSSAREVNYSLSEGRYKFNLLSVNDEGLTQDSPLSFEITVKHPFWRTWWFMLGFLGALAGLVVLIIREREKAQKKIQEYLEKELEARTKVVFEQKAELELQNLEITDSINYAKRIQSSILPDTKRLREQFNDAFVMLYPRDIVSGDFYWFDKLDDDRFIMVCADSTGHGVPGAFMSMIGTTLLQDIVTRQRISKPSEILSMLDKQIFSILNQNLELGVSNDGMDIVVCEFTMKNRHIRFASAMRPVILVMGGEIYYIKGNRSSVGGQSVMEKYFDDQEYFLNEGDSLYLFSDGLPDQFGGQDGKKMKVNRLKSWISETYSLPLEQQYEALTRNFSEWKGNFEQVDDILLMGVRI